MRSGSRHRPLAVAALAVLSAATLAGLSTRATATPDGLKVALVTPGPVTDAGWNALAKEGLDRIAKEIPGTTLQHVQQGSPQKFEDDLKDFARGGAQLVFAHGFEYQEACEKVAAKFTELKDGSDDDATKLKNVKALRAEVGQKLSTGFLAVVADMDTWIKEAAAKPATEPVAAK